MSLRGAIATWQSHCDQSKRDCHAVARNDIGCYGVVFSLTVSLAISATRVVYLPFLTAGNFILYSTFTIPRDISFKRFSSKRLRSGLNLSVNSLPSIWSYSC